MKRSKLELAFFFDYEMKTFVVKERRKFDSTPQPHPTPWKVYGLKL